jgi:hypothetical protein
MGNNNLKHDLIFRNSCITECALSWVIHRIHFENIFTVNPNSNTRGLDSADSQYLAYILDLRTPPLSVGSLPLPKR